MTIDPALLGYWQNIDGVMEFNADGWTYAFGRVTFQVSSDDAILTITAPNGVVTLYTRVAGTGGSLEGTWRLEQIDAGVLWREEWTFLASGAYALVWTVGGQIDSVLFGYFITAGNVMKTRERRGKVTTDPYGTLLIDKPYDPDEVGTYSISPQGVLSLVLNAQSVTLQPIPAP